MTESIYRESPIKARVGKGKAILYVLPGPLIQDIPALTTIVAGPQEAAGGNTLDWSEFDEETIDCVLKFCYGRNLEQ